MQMRLSSMINVLVLCFVTLLIATSLLHYTVEVYLQH